MNLQVQFDAMLLHSGGAMMVYGVQVTTKANPTVLRRQLGTELRRMREQAKRTVAWTAEQLGWSESKVSRVETAHIGIRRPDLERLLALYGVSDVERDRLISMAQQARQRAWWEVYGDTLFSSYETYIGFEAEASSIRTFEPTIVPGLLQTAEYAKAVIRVDYPDDPDLVSQRVSVRMARQEILTRDPAAQFWAILDETVLRRPIGGPHVMRRQLMRLVEVSELSMITIQVLPMSVGAHRALAGSFVLLEFPNATEHPLVYCEGMTGGVFRSKPDEVSRYRDSFESLRAASMDPQCSVEFIAAVAQGEK
ncbi:helix-turn-helix domain-containing protein [Allorhizocola rhizosphaerae]|uniref:helix-turn-helix domain-containing protein n=1 Tax=Allorhizocola rhizosphaerae TaxID=1872709 RepID=UPI000E3C390C|nr:helix-turn-helix transcriptional regulator [Allorhizocola rhizosphaerae]